MILLFNEGMWSWFLVVFFAFSAIAVYFSVRRYSRILKITDPNQSPPQAPPAGSEEAEWDRQQREAWEREHPDWVDWERSKDKEPPKP